VPIGNVLVVDASRRTRKANAYVSGLGRTRRVVLSDTLLAEASPAELRLVVAHELGHRRDQHVLRATLLAMAGAVAATVVVWRCSGDGLPTHTESRSCSSSGSGSSSRRRRHCRPCRAGGNAPPIAARSN